MCQLITLMDQQEIVESCLFLIPISIQMTHIQLTSFQQDLLHVLLLFLSWWRWIPKTEKHHLQDQRLPGTISVDPPRQHPPMSGCWTVLRSLWSKISSCWPKLLVTKTFDLLILAKMLVSCITYTILVAGLTEKVRTLQQCWNILTLKS